MKMLSATDKYVLNRCKKDRTFAKDYAYYNQALDTALVVYQQRTKLHFSQQELADKAGVPRSTVARIEDGDMNPSTLTLDKIAKACHKRLVVEMK